MEKNLTCVSTTPEEMYWELQAEREQMHLNELARTMPDKDMSLLLTAKKGRLNEEDQIEALYSPNAEKILLAQAEKGELCKTVQRKIARAFYNNRHDFPNISSLFLILAKRGELGISGQVCAFLLPNAQEIIIAQHQNGRLFRNGYDKAHARGWL